MSTVSRIWSCKIAVDEVFGLFRLSIGSSDAIGTASWPDGQAVLPAYAVDPPVTAGITPVESEPGDDPPDAVVAAVLFILLQTFVNLLQQFPVPPTLFRPPEGAVVLYEMLSL